MRIRIAAWDLDHARTRGVRYEHRRATQRTRGAVAPRGPARTRRCGPCESRRDDGRRSYSSPRSPARTDEGKSCGSRLQRVGCDLAHGACRCTACRRIRRRMITTCAPDAGKDGRQGSAEGNPRYPERRAAVNAAAGLAIAKAEQSERALRDLAQLALGIAQAPAETPDVSDVKAARLPFSIRRLATIGVSRSAAISQCCAI
jgi:hypothetical protein